MRMASRLRTPRSGGGGSASGGFTLPRSFCSSRQMEPGPTNFRGNHDRDPAMRACFS